MREMSRCLFCLITVAEYRALESGRPDSIETGLWLTDDPIEMAASGRPADVILTVNGLDEDALRPFEVTEQDHRYRDWLVPASLIHGRYAFDLDEQDLTPR